MSNLNIGIIGTGIFATTSHLPALQGLNDKFTPAGAFNRTKAKAEKFATTASIPASNVFDTVDELLADPKIDVVDILVPVQYNLSVLEKAIAHGKPAIIEKPIAATMEDARAIVKLDRSTDVPIVIAENWLYIKLGDLILEHLPKIGKIISFNYRYTGPYNSAGLFMNTPWRLKPEHIGGYISDGGVHQLALLTKVVGQISSISAQTTQVQKTSGAVDTLFSTVKADSGAIGAFIYASSFGATKKNCVFTIFGENGSINADFSPREDKSASGEITVITGTSLQDSKAEPVIFYKENDSFGISDEFLNFHEAIVKKDKKLIVSKPENGFHHLAIVAAALESAEKNGASVAVEKI